MRVEAAMDAGPVLLQRAVPIEPEDDAGTLHDRLTTVGASALGDALQALARGEATWTPQDEAQVTWAPKLRDEDCRLDLAEASRVLVNRVRGLSPEPGAYLLLGDRRRLKVLRAEARAGAGQPGAILSLEPEALVLGAGDGALALLQVQPEGKRRMAGAEFARGRRLQLGTRLDQTERSEA
jgi:methionyl-tRNA formyltransferase